MDKKGITTFRLPKMTKLKPILVVIFLLTFFDVAQSQSCEAIFSYDATTVDVSFTDLSSIDNNDQITSWSWDFDGLGSSSMQNPTFTFPEPGKYDVILTISTQNGCTSTIEIRIEICSLDVSYSLGICSDTGLIPIDITINDIYDSADEIEVTVNGQPVNGSPFLIDIDNPVVISDDLQGNGVTHILTVNSNDVTNCGQVIEIPVEDCTSDCFLSGIQATLAGSNAHEIQIGDNFFSPSSIAVDIGDLISFVWVGDGHSTTSDATSGIDSWNSGVLGIGSTFETIIDNPGIHPYYCIPHGAPGGVGMSAEILANCPDATSLNIELSFNTTIAGTGGYNILVDGQPVSGSPFQYTGTGNQTQVINIAGDNNEHIIELIDVDDPTCTLSLTYSSPDCNQGGGEPVCNISMNILNTGNCNVSNEVPVQLEIIGSNTGASFNVSIDNGPVQNFQYTGNNTVIDVIVPGDGLVHSVTATDDTDPACAAEVAVTSLDCSLPCNISNLTAIPPSSDGSPSGIIHRVDVEDFQFSPATINISTGDQVQWVWTGAIAHTSTSDATSGINAWDSGLLGNGASFTSPVLDEGSHPYYCIPHGGPGGQGMSGIINVSPPCNPDGTVDVEISFEIQSPGPNGYTILVDGEAVSTHSYSAGSNQKIAVPVIADGLSHTIIAQDNGDPGCASSVGVITPSCNTNSCGLILTHTQPSECNNGLVTITLGIQSGLLNTDFEILIDGVYYGIINTLNNGSNTIDLDLSGRGNNVIVTARNMLDPTCTDSINVTLPECHVDCVIQEIIIDTSSYTHIVEVRDFEFFPKDFSILVGDTVRFVWVGDIPHTVTSDRTEGVDSWDSGLWGKGHVYDLVIENPGQNPYYCIPHGGPGGVGMAGTINVIDTCAIDSSYYRVNVHVTGGSPLGYFWFLDGIKQKDIPTKYDDRNGKNTLVLKWPADGEVHTLTIQDGELETCARSIDLVAEKCDTTCIVSNLSAQGTGEVIHDIEVRDFDFFPGDITVRVGEKIRFTWTGGVPHTTTSDAITGIDSWDSGLLEKGAVFEIAITTPGDHPYYCIPHGGPGGIGMAGNIKALPICDDGTTSMTYTFEVRNGSSQGYNIFVDGAQVSDIPLAYNNINGINSGTISLPGDGQQHMLTIQDVESPICALSTTFSALQCLDSCSIAGLSYTLKTAKKDTILVKDFEFSPKEITVETGDTIIFIWEGDIPHTVTSDAVMGNSVFNSGLLGIGERYTLILEDTGIHPYYCIPHGAPGGVGMAGTINVNEKCDDGALDFEFSFFNEGNGSAYTVVLNGATAIDKKDYLDGPSQSFDLPILGNNEDHIIRVIDLSIQDCATEILIPGFDCNDPCINLRANFNFSIDQNTNSVSLEDNSQGNPESWTWELGDGSIMEGPEITYTYQERATYEICLTVAREDGCSNTYCDKVNLNETICDVSFDYTLDGLKITFTNTSTISDTMTEGIWNFGDGSNLPISDTVSHVYQPGIYEVCLLVTSPACNALYCDTLDLTDPCLVFEADFDLQVDPDDDLMISFIDRSSVNTNRWLWGFGDGNTVDVKDPTHVFSSPGTYSVCLLAQDTNTPCSDAHCIPVVVGSTATGEAGLERKKLNVFPNPVRDQQQEIFITGFRENEFGKKTTISIYSLNGRQVFKGNFNIQQEITIHPLQIGVGMYIVHILTENGSYSKKLLVL